MAAINKNSIFEYTCYLAFWIGVYSLLILFFLAMAVAYLPENVFIKFDATINILVGVLFGGYFVSAIFLSIGFFLWVFRGEDNRNKKAVKFLAGVFMILGVGYWWYFKHQK